MLGLIMSQQITNASWPLKVYKPLFTFIGIKQRETLAGLSLPKIPNQRAVS